MINKLQQVLAPIRTRGLTNVGQRVLSDPGAVYRHIQGNEYNVLSRNSVESPPSTRDVESCASVVGASPERATAAWLELHADETFRTELRERLWLTSYGPDKVYSNWRDLLYVLVRLVEPDTVVETGVRGGFSSAYILDALERNGHGQLISIDIGDVSPLPPDLANREVGWLVPDRLRSRWQLHIGDSSELLPGVYSEHRVDMVLSDTPNSVLREELSLASESLDPGSVIVTSSPAGSEAARIWDRFTAEHASSSVAATRWRSEESHSSFGVAVLSE